MQINVEDPELNWLTEEGSFDPLGRVFMKDDVFYRAVYNEKVAYVQELMDNGILANLADRQLMPRQFAEAISHARYGLILRSESAKWPIDYFRFPLEALRDSTLVWIAINRALSQGSYGLSDGHYGNFALFGNSTPKWVDVGSIVPIKRQHMLKPKPVIGRFFSKLVYPILVLSRVPKLIPKRDRIIRQGGLAKEVAQQILRDSGAAGFTEEENSLLWSPANLRRTEIFEGLEKLVSGLNFKWPEVNWSRYRKHSLSQALDGDRIDNDPRERTVFELVKRIKPREIIDMGANKGYHSVVFASQGFDVLAIDTDELSVNSCYTWLKDQPNLLVCCSVNGFQTAKQKADLVVSLALTHHLTFAAKLTFDQIAKRYADMAKRHLLVEFMPNGIGGTVPKPHPLPDWYTLENFLASFRRHFGDVRVVEWDGPRDPALGLRTLVHCSERKSIP